MKRRNFISNTSLLLAGTTLLPQNIFTTQKEFISLRPKLADRKFVSKAVENVITEVKSEIKDKELAWLFENCFPNTLDTTIDFEIIDGKPDTFVITGDIDAMWLRDSTAQVWPYMPLIKKDKKLKELIKGLINRQVKCVLLDPYANAFFKDKTRISHWKSDITQMLPGVHERKWEIDSLCYVVRLANEYYQITKDTSIFDANWDKAMRSIVKTFKTEQRKNNQSEYVFSRETTSVIDAPPFNGTGRPVKPNGLICSMFRPSDDATMYPYLIPSNIFAVVSLRQLHDIYSTAFNDKKFANACKKLADEVESAIQKYAVTEHLDFGKIYAYEVDGFGNKLFMDDANVPSLMSLAYLGAHKNTDAIYKRTRKFLLSDNNPYFLKGALAEGQASPHTGKNKIWPMGIILRAMTSTNDAEIKKCLKMLKATHAGKGFMHEGFDKDNPNNYSRDWFAWANTLFGELILKIYNEKRSLLAKEY
ncbi:glycoside hydrolase family 125 protein [Polaribacter batillariae]|uniref:Glycoside hydrolase family 125 protein n=1 Tax=Polaribacter batillariae TaxID=2808900 RepID=A0ABX7SS08_9FLAO|nr:glycoside hydrolase family 125 protein [Polaribacter batillariae]QTD37045.1 glycoside hydrolase family 125 protein [Polaribacter batillariae]